MRVDSKFIPAKALASLIGEISSISPALGLVTRLRTRSLYAVLNSRVSWCEVLLLSQAARDKLVFWRAHIETFNGQGIWPSPSAVRFVYSDASSTGYGGYYNYVDHGSSIANGQ